MCTKQHKGPYNCLRCWGCVIASFSQVRFKSSLSCAAVVSEVVPVFRSPVPAYRQLQPFLRQPQRTYNEWQLVV